MTEKGLQQLSKNIEKIGSVARKFNITEITKISLALSDYRSSMRA